jgi:hypothetical protein
MAQRISFMLQDDQIATLEKASLTEGVNFIEEAGRIFERGLQVTKNLIETELSSKDPQIADFEAKGAWLNSQDFCAIVSSTAFREQFSKEVTKSGN